jgi:hypothetical protein
MIDLRKAFDKTGFYGILNLLIKNNINPDIVRVLDHWFGINTARIKWGDALSKCVHCKSGVRQGGILSPLLFSVFIDIILQDLELSGLGCFINKKCLNSFLYADDLILLSISITDLQRLVNICSARFAQLDLPINYSKSHCLRVGPRCNVICASIIVDGYDLKWLDSSKYLGVLFLKGKKFTCNWLANRSNFYKCSNSIFSKFGSSAPVNIILKLVQSICFPILFYGTPAVSLSKKDINSFSFAYNNIFSKLFKTTDAITIRLCQYYCYILPFEQQYDLFRFNFLIKSAGTLSMKSLLSQGECEVLSCLCAKYKLNANDSKNSAKNKIWRHFELSFELQ